MVKCSTFLFTVGVSIKQCVEFSDLIFANSGICEEINVLIVFYWTFFTGIVRRCTAAKNLFAMETKIGWVISGPLNEKVSLKVESFVTSSYNHLMKINCQAIVWKTVSLHSGNSNHLE